MVKAADILLAGPSVRRHIYLHVTSVPKTWPLISRINKKATWALDPFTSPFQILTVASILCKPIPSSVLNTHMEHKQGGASRGLEESWQYFSITKDLGSSEWTSPTMSSHINRWVTFPGSSPLPLANPIISQQKWRSSVLLIQPNPLHSNFMRISHSSPPTSLSPFLSLLKIITFLFTGKKSSIT